MPYLTLGKNQTNCIHIASCFISTLRATQTTTLWKWLVIDTCHLFGIQYCPNDNFYQYSIRLWDNFFICIKKIQVKHSVCYYLFMMSINKNFTRKERGKDLIDHFLLYVLFRENLEFDYICSQDQHITASSQGCPQSKLNIHAGTGIDTHRLQLFVWLFYSKTLQCVIFLQFRRDFESPLIHF